MNRLQQSVTWEETLISNFFDKAFSNKIRKLRQGIYCLFSLFAPSGITYALADFKSELILTSVTVTKFVFNEVFLLRFLEKICPKFCLTSSPTLKCL